MIASKISLLIVITSVCGQSSATLRGFWPLNVHHQGKEISGRGNDANVSMVTADADDSSGALNDALGYSFSGGEHIRIRNNNGDLHVSRDFTLLFHVRAPFPVPVNTAQALLGWEAAFTGNTEGVHVALNNGGTGALTFDLNLYDNTSRVGPGVHTATSSVIGDGDTWLPVAIIYDGASGTARISTDRGVTTATTTGPPLGVLDTEGDLLIGIIPDVSSDPFSGAMTCLQLHDVALDLMTFDWDGVLDTCTKCSSPNAFFLDGFCYEPVIPSTPAEEKSWDEAEAACSNATLKCNLATVFNQRLQDALSTWVTDAKGLEPEDMDLWIGLRRETHSDPYTWASHDSEYSNWLLHPNSTFDEPTGGSDELCVAMMHSPVRAGAQNITDLGTFSWSDEDCSLTKGYVCQCNTLKSFCDKSLIRGIFPATSVRTNSDFRSPLTNASSVEGAALGSRAVTSEDQNRTEFGAWSTEDMHSLDYHIEISKEDGEYWIVREVWTQGKAPLEGAEEEWVRSYYLSYSLDGTTYTEFTEQGQSAPKLFIGNRNSDGIKRHVLQHPIAARYVRINPIGYTQGMEKYSMRVELIGCRDHDVSGGDDVMMPDGHEVYRLGFYQGKQAGIDTGISNIYDGSDTNCYTVPSATYHTAWMHQTRFNLPATNKRYQVKVRGKYIPCEQKFHPLSPGHPILSVNDYGTPDSMAHEGTFRDCTLLQQIGSEATVNVTCSYLCEGGSINTGHRLSTLHLTLEDAPDGVTSPQWEICSLEAYTTDE